MRPTSWICFTFAAVLVLNAVRADEGMWVYNNLPKKTLKDKYGFEPSSSWAENLKRASVRFVYGPSGGGSGSFVSSDGLVLTNHHVAAHALDKISTEKRNLRADTFLAATQADEISTKNLEINALVSITDVTKEVEAAVIPGMTPEKANAARKAASAKIEKDAFDKTGYRSDVVTLYQGGQYHLYQYKRYQDVRLVFAPEHKIAFFGGDQDNFEFPRYDLDMTIFRVYENGKPAKIDHYLRWSKAGAKENELIFVSGHPGRTNRLYTVDALKYLRDKSFPYTLALYKRREIALLGYANRSDENLRRAKDQLFGVQNARKAFLGRLEGLLSQDLFDQKEREEKALREKVEANPKFKSVVGAWHRISSSLKVQERLMIPLSLLETGAAFNSQLFQIARTLVRLHEEDAKPNGERLDYYRDSNRPSLVQTLYSSAPIYPDFEIAMLTDSLSHLAEAFGADDPTVRLVLAGKSPRIVATLLVSQSQLADVEKRKDIAKGGAKAIQDSDDPMIMIAKVIDKKARALRKEYEEKVEEVQNQAYGLIAKARFAEYGTSVYPDATFTLRLAFGTVKGYQENGTKVAPWTTFGGAFDYETKQGGKDPWALPATWKKAKGSLDLTTPFNFVSTADIIGGNSGSPVVNRDGELVGLIFDGNIQSLSADSAYSEDQARALAVHSAGILEAMRKVYGATALADALGR